MAFKSKNIASQIVVDPAGLGNSVSTDLQSVLDDLDAAIVGEANTASSLGGTSIFGQKNGVNLEFKGLAISGDGLSIGSDGTSVTLSNTDARAATAINNIASPYALLAADRVVIVDSSAAVVTVTLPAAAAASGRLVKFKAPNAGTNAVTLDGAAAETIDGAATFVMSANFEAVELYCDGTEWHSM